MRTGEKVASSTNNLGQMIGCMENANRSLSLTQHKTHLQLDKGTQYKI